MRQKMRPALHSEKDAGGLADRVLLCIPRGGLNDTLCQIDKCLRYAEEYGRQLIVDARQSGLMGPFSDYFDLHTASVDVIGRPEPRHIEMLNAWDCYPREIRGRLDTPRRRKGGTTFADDDFEVPLSFDFSIDYPQPLLVHERSGGGFRSRDFLNRVVLADDVLATVRDRLSVLPPEYLGVHVRNTDLKTDFKSFVQDIYPSTVGKTVLVCSDDAGVIAHAQQVLDRAEIVTTSIPGTGRKGRGSRPLHRGNRYGSDAERRSHAIDALVDLLALGGASDVLFAKCSNKSKYSGFSELAAYLCSNKHVVASLLSSPLTLSEDEVRRLVIALDRRSSDGQREEERRKMRRLLEARREDEVRRAALRGKIDGLRNKLQEMRARDDDLREKLDAVRAVNASLRSSWSWRITAPLRAIQAWTRKGFGSRG